MTKVITKRRTGQRFKSSGQGRNRLLKTAVAAALMQLAITPASWALEFETDNPDFKARWDNTVKYSAAFRLKNQSPGLIADANTDDGDRNFNKGLISNRVDLLSELDLAYKNSGFRLSGAAWHETVYNRKNDHGSPSSASQSSVAFDEFTAATRKLHGGKAEVLDAFVYSRF